MAAVSSTTLSSSAQASLSSSVDASKSASVAASISSSVAASISSSIAEAVSSSVLAGSTVTVEPSTTNVVTSVVSISAAPATTELVTSVVTQPATDNGQSTLPAITVVVTSTNNPATAATATETSAGTSTSASASSTSSTPATLSNTGDSSKSSGGLSAAGTTAVAVVVPVVVVALLVLAGLFFWRRRKQRKAAAEARRKEVEDYGFNPNNDPTLPTVAADGHSEMTEDNNGYRGWGAAATGGRAESSTLSNGNTQAPLSDSGSNAAYPIGAASAASATASDGNSSDAMIRRPTIGSDDLGALGAAPLAGANRNQDILRGPSNASSHYTVGAHSDNSEGAIGQAFSSDVWTSTPPQSYGYGQSGPYGDGSYGGGDGMPVVRDVSARRNTRIEQGGGYQQGNSGIAQNF